MIVRSVTQSGKGWYTGRWDSVVPVALGYSDFGVDEVHLHREMYEIYLVARGTSIAIVDGGEVHLSAGQVLVVEPGEVHTVRDSSEDHFHFVIQAPFVPGDKLLVENG